MSERPEGAGAAYARWQQEEREIAYLEALYKLPSDSTASPTTRLFVYGAILLVALNALAFLGQAIGLL